MKKEDLKELLIRENVADIPSVVKTLVAFANDYSNLGGGIDGMFNKNPSLSKSASMLDTRAKANMDLAKKTIETAKNFETPKDLKLKAWDGARVYLRNARMDLNSALDNASSNEKYYLEKDFEFLNHLDEIVKRPEKRTKHRHQNQKKY